MILPQWVQGERSLLELVNTPNFITSISSYLTSALPALQTSLIVSLETSLTEFSF